MKYILIFILSLSPLFAKLNVQTTYQAIAEVTKKVGGEHVSVNALANPKYDPHFIVPRPSLISKLRSADMIIINGAGLESGWLPPLLKGANNPKIRTASEGFIDLSHSIELIDKPAAVSRAFGDVHAEGNPHYIMDPHNILPLAKAIAQRLGEIDPKNRVDYAKNFDKFSQEWSIFLNKLDAKVKESKDKKVVQYHKLFNYFLSAYGYENYGSLEPLPGISPSSKHSMELINSIKSQGVTLILQDVYHEQKSAEFIAEKSGAKVVVLPHDVGAVDEADTLERFYEVIVQRLCQ